MIYSRYIKILKLKFIDIILYMISMLLLNSLNLLGDDDNWP
jgi:hypothetical protein